MLMKMVLLMLEVKTILSFREGFRQELHLGEKIVEVFEISYIFFSSNCGISFYGL